MVSADVRYGLEEPQTRYVADLALRPGDMVWLFACLPGDVWIAARVPWNDNLWLILAANGIQPADCPVDVGPVRRGLLERSTSQVTRSVDSNRRTLLKNDFPLKRNISLLKGAHDRRTRFDGSHNRAFAAKVTR